MDRRGGKGDVIDIWYSFRNYFKWVTGVAGNHDRFGSELSDLTEFLMELHINYLDGDPKFVDSIKIGGIGCVIGNPTKPFRRRESDFTGCINQLVSNGIDILILHEGPDVPDKNLPGSPAIRV
ncbi:hypothetical protein K8T06_00480 [bacterium]|nr:hypothetical protein [bacterium]